MSKVGTARSVSPLSGIKGDATKNYVSCRNRREPGRKARAGSTAAGGRGGAESLSLVDAGDLNVSSHRIKMLVWLCKASLSFHGIHRIDALHILHVTILKNWAQARSPTSFVYSPRIPTPRASSHCA